MRIESEGYLALGAAGVVTVFAVFLKDVCFFFVAKMHERIGFWGLLKKC